MVDRLDDGFIAADIGPLDYKGLYKVVWWQSLYGMMLFEYFILLTCALFRLLGRHSLGHMSKVS